MTWSASTGSTRSARRISRSSTRSARPSAMSLARRSSARSPARLRKSASCALVKNLRLFRHVVEEVGLGCAHYLWPERDEYLDTFKLLTRVMRTHGQRHLISRKLVRHFFCASYEAGWRDAALSELRSMDTDSGHPRRDSDVLVALSRLCCFQMNCAVILRVQPFNSCGGPSNNTSPPALPPSGPRSMIQSACRITSR